MSLGSVSRAQISREGVHIKVMMSAHLALIREVSRILGPLMKACLR